MTRVFLEVLTLFLMPTAVYLAYKLLTLRPGAGMTAVIARAPVITLAVIGACLVGLMLTLVASTGGGKPGQTYEPAQMKDGKLIPGRMK